MSLGMKGLISILPTCHNLNIHVHVMLGEIVVELIIFYPQQVIICTSTFCV